MRAGRVIVFSMLAIQAGGCSSTPAEEDQVAAVDDEVICRTERELGSTFKRRTCKTIAEWRADREAAKELALTRRPDFNAPAQPGGAGRE